MIIELDKNKDGSVSLDEFINFLDSKSNLINSLKFTDPNEKYNNWSFLWDKI